MVFGFQKLCRLVVFPGLVVVVVDAVCEVFLSDLLVRLAKFSDERLEVPLGGRFACWQVVEVLFVFGCSVVFCESAGEFGGVVVVVYGFVGCAEKFFPVELVAFVEGHQVEEITGKTPAGKGGDFGKGKIGEVDHIDAVNDFARDRIFAVSEVGVGDVNLHDDTTFQSEFILEDWVLLVRAADEFQFGVFKNFGTFGRRFFRPCLDIDIDAPSFKNVGDMVVVECISSGPASAGFEFGDGFKDFFHHCGGDFLRFWFFHFGEFLD
jgi:hypothetical protein